MSQRAFVALLFALIATWVVPVALGSDTGYNAGATAAMPPDATDPPPDQYVLGWQSSGVSPMVIPGDGGGSTDRLAIVDYATRYVGTYLGGSNQSGWNSSYLSFPNDCQNFASQALHAGHWQDIVPPWLTTGDDHYWYYGYYSPTTYSASWANSSRFANHVYITGRRPFLRYWYQANLGDIVLVDWDGPPLHINHTAIVTRIANGDIYLTYHTNNRLNISLKALQSGNPNARWWLVSAS